MPTPSKPLTPSFPSPGPRTDLPAGHHPATPRFLLSLLATAVYLSIPSTASQALNAILSSVGPYTVVRYLDFAIGKPIERPHENEPVAAVGLEKLAEELHEDATYAATPSISSDKRNQGTEVSPEQMSQKLEDLDIKKEDPSESLSDCSEMEHEYPTQEASFHYGAVSDKIGEATACWLARWGPDILAYEENTSKDVPVPTSTCIRPTSLPSPGVRDNPPNCGIPTVWGRGGLNSKWIRALISSDSLFVEGERERYEFAKSVVDLRRRSGVDDEEEEEWTRMFSSGIYYSHMVVSPRLLSASLLSDIRLFSHWTTSSYSREIYHQSLAGHTSHYLSCKRHTGTSHYYGTK
jgi:hypothetical protein